MPYQETASSAAPTSDRHEDYNGPQKLDRLLS